VADQVTVDNAGLPDFTVVSDEITSPYTGGTAQAQAVKILSGTADSNAVIPGDATNGLDVDVTRVGGTVTVAGTVTADTELVTADLDTGGGTDTKPVVGLLLANAGGADIWPGDDVSGAFVQVKTMPAAAVTTDSLGAADMTNVVMNGLTSLTPKFAKANVAASTTDGSIVAAVGGKKIRVLAFRIHTAGTATNVTFNSKPAGAGTAISELFALGANGGHSPGYSPVGHFETVSGEGLTVTTGTGATTGIGVVYVEV